MGFELLSWTRMLSSAGCLNCFCHRLKAAGLERHSQVLQHLCLLGGIPRSTSHTLPILLGTRSFWMGVGECIVPMEVSQGSVPAIRSSDVKRRSMSPNYGLYHDVDAQAAELI